MKTRFAPSPTGYLHIGGARTALFCWLFARNNNGSFILRIEDTDRERSTEASINAILEAMDWLNLDYDEGPYYQTQRFDRYREVVQQLLDEDKAYYCYCTREELDALRAEQMANKQDPRYDGRYRDYKGPPREGVQPVVRFKNPLTGEVSFDDMIRGRISKQNRELDDLIIMRSDGTPTYNFCVVVDDLDMEITHVIRGDDHINNTPRQINIMQALGATLPQFAHLPMILGNDGSRLSKRHGAVSVMQYHEDGYLPQALLNYLVRLGWSHGDQEIFSRDEMIALFDIHAVNKAASAFNPEKLQWLNQQYLKNTPPEDIAPLLQYQLEKLGIDTSTGPDLAEVAAAFQERAKTLTEMAAMSEFLYRDFADYDEKSARKNLKPDATQALQALQNAFQDVAEWNGEAAHTTLLQVAEALELKLGKVAQPLRVAVCGRAASPPMDTTLELLGQDQTLQRIQRALNYIAENG